MIHKTLRDLVLTFSKGGVSSYLEVERSQKKVSKFINLEKKDKDLAKIIIDAYLSWKKIESKSHLKDKIGPSKLWSKLIETNQSSVLTACRNRDSLTLAKNLKNIYRSDATLAMTYPDAQNIPGSPIHRNIYAKLRVARSIFTYKKNLSKNLDVELVEKLLSLIENNFGNPMIVNINGKKVSFEAMYHALVLIDLNELEALSYLKKRNIVDIGSGLGLVLSLLAALCTGTKCTFVDLPENLIYAAWFINQYCPELKINYGLNGKNYDNDCDINLLPYICIDDLPANEIDLFINSFALTEMDICTSEIYLKYISDKLSLKGKFFSINRTVPYTNGTAGYVMSGMTELMERSGLFTKVKEIALEDSFSQNNDFIYSAVDTEVAIYEKKNKFI